MEEPINLPKEKIITYTPLVYNADTDFSTITNVLLVDTNVQDYKKFVENVNSSTFAITFSQGSKGQDIVDLLAAKLPSITRIAIVANDSMMASGKRLFSYKPYFESSDLEMDSSRTSYSENLQLLIDLIKTHSVQTIDYLACNSLTFDNWKAYYSILTKETGVTVGASNDQTGNILSGGDWTMESTGVDIEAIYFTSGISNYQGTLEITLIGGNVTLSMGDGGVVYSKDDGPETPMSWPCTLRGDITVTLGEDLTLTSVVSYFIIENVIGNDVTIDGNGYTIIVNNVPDYPGLVDSQNANTTVKNIGLLSIGSTTTLANNGGWIGQTIFKGAITNCYSNGTISGESSGGIAGYNAGNGGICTITNCHSTGAISGESSGGIAGRFAGFDGGNCTISNCYSTGAISGEFSGGIAGFGAGRIGGNCTITNCYSTGDISSVGSGGITGANVGRGGICTITNCYSTGGISGDSSGGIAGNGAGIASSFAGYDSTCAITNCYSTGGISGDYSGGIAGAGAGFGAGRIGGNCTITNCYSTGAITGIESGGIAGIEAGADAGNCEISNCYSTGAISGDDSGGIAGNRAGYDGGICEISNCYSTGAISSDGSSGIVPGNVVIPKFSGHSNGWLSSIASNYLVNTSGIWKRFLAYVDDDLEVQNIPWKIVTFLTGVTITTNILSNETTITYTSDTFPVNPYGGVVQISDGINTPITGMVDTTGKVATFTFMSGVFETDSLITIYNNSANPLNTLNTFYAADITSSITSTTSMTRDDIYNYKYTYPLPVSGTTTVTIDNGIIVSNLRFTIANSNSNNVTIDGNGYTITVNNVPNYPGLVDSKDANTTVKKIGLLISGTTTLADSAGWIGQGALYGILSFIGTIDNCYSNGDISGIQSGGIAGAYAGVNGECTITNCYSTGAISGLFSGGIAGDYAGARGGICNIRNCHSTGDISGIESGGIAGDNAGGEGGNCTISNCYSTGDISGNSSGGIAGDDAGDSGNCTITNCYSTGAISGNQSGGIAGDDAGIDGNCTITNCYSTGAISGENSGGIAGDDAGDSGNCTITNCYSTGDITGDGSGGIAGADAGDNGDNGGICTISNCYSTGAISGTDSGGIAGVGATNGCSIRNCYTTGAISGTDSGGIQPNNSSADVSESSHSDDGWSDTTNTLLKTDGVWKPIFKDYPWKLSSFLTNAIVTYTYDGSTLVYNSSLFPIVTYGIGVLPDPKIQLLYNGSNKGTPVNVDTIQRSITFNSISGLDNGQSTTLQLLSGTTSYDYLNVLIISTTTSTTTLPPTQFSVVQFAINARFSLIDTPGKKANYEVTLKDEVVNVTDAPPSTVTVIGVRPGSIINTVRLPTEYVQLLQDAIQSGKFEITIDGVIYEAIPGSFIILDNICFQKGTMILTPSGYRAVESLNSGDLLKTAQDRITKVQSVTSFTGKVDKCPLYVLPKGILGTNKPIVDLYMSEGHAYRNNGKWCHMKCSSVAMKLDEDNIEYYNIVLDNYFEHTLVANGVEVESLFKVSGLEMTWNCKTDNCKPVISLKK